MNLSDLENYAHQAAAQALGLKSGATDKDLAMAAANKLALAANPVALGMAAEHYVASKATDLANSAQSKVHAAVHAEATAAGHAAVAAAEADLQKQSGGLILVGVAAVAGLLLAIGLK